MTREKFASLNFNFTLDLFKKLTDERVYFNIVILCLFFFFGLVFIRRFRLAPAISL